MNCIRCSNELPRLAKLEGDPYCSRRCCQLDVIGVDTDIDNERGKTSAGQGKRMRDERGISFSIRRSRDRGTSLGRFDA